MEAQAMEKLRLSPLIIACCLIFIDGSFRASIKRKLGCGFNAATAICIASRVALSIFI
jgi:hypothetical protein